MVTWSTKPIAASMAGSAKVDVQILDGGGNRGGPCRAGAGLECRGPDCKAGAFLVSAASAVVKKGGFGCVCDGEKKSK